MGKSRRFGLVAAAVIGARALDLWATWAVSPSLRGETHPVVSLLGAGWPGLLAWNVLLAGAVLWVAHRALVRPAPPTPPGMRPAASGGGGSGEKVSLRYFIVAHWFAGRPRPWWHAWWRFPTRRSLLGYWAGVMLPPVLIVESVAAAAHNLWSVGRSYEDASFAAVYAVALLAFVVGQWWFFVAERRRAPASRA